MPHPQSLEAKKTQRARLLELFLSARGAEVGLPQILSLRISQFGARLKELRGLGFTILNRQEHHGGQTHSWYRLISSPTSTAATAAPGPESEAAPSLFPDQKGAHVDDG